jgi:hypothetical protein
MAVSPLSRLPPIAPDAVVLVEGRSDQLADGVLSHL